MAHILTLILFFFHASLYSLESLTFFDILKNDQMSKWHEKEVIIRGFLYRDPVGNLILSHEPNLKSCCLGKKKQIFVFPKQSFDELSKRAITLKGRFVVNGDEYSLKEAEF